VPRARRLRGNVLVATGRTVISTVLMLIAFFSCSSTGRRWWHGSSR
jgi:hypothetical protein